MTSLPPDPADQSPSGDAPSPAPAAEPKKRRGRVRWGLIGALILLTGILILSIQNTQPVEVHFLAWTTEQLPLSVVILATALGAVLLDELFGIAWRVRRKRRAKAKG